MPTIAMRQAANAAHALNICPMQPLFIDSNISYCIVPRIAVYNDVCVERVLVNAFPIGIHTMV